MAWLILGSYTSSIAMIFFLLFYIFYSKTTLKPNLEVMTILLKP